MNITQPRSQTFIGHIALSFKNTLSKDPQSSHTNQKTQVISMLNNSIIFAFTTQDSLKLLIFRLICL